MDQSDPILLVSSVAVIAIALAPVAGWLIGRGAAAFLAEAGPTESANVDLSRIRDRRR